MSARNKLPVLILLYHCPTCDTVFRSLPFAFNDIWEIPNMVEQYKEDNPTAIHLCGASATRFVTTECPLEGYEFIDHSGVMEQLRKATGDDHANAT